MTGARADNALALANAHSALGRSLDGVATIVRSLKRQYTASSHHTLMTENIEYGANKAKVALDVVIHFARDLARLQKECIEPPKEQPADNRHDTP